MRVAHVITRMIIGGAQENTLYNCLDLQEIYADDVVLLTGPTEGPEGRLLEQGRAGGLKVELIPSLKRAINPIHDWKAHAELHAALKRLKPDVVHTHSAKAGMLGRAVAWRLKVPAVIHTVHGAPFHPYQSAPARLFFQACERWAAKRCHRLISVADAMTDLMVDAKVAPRSKFTTVYSGMEVEPFLSARQHRDAMRKQLGFNETDVVIGKIARLFPLKGHEYVVAAAAEVIAKAPQVKFLLVGDGILRESLEQEVQRQGIAKHFRFIGLVPPARIPEYLGAMDLLLHTSLREGLARALPQALISGIPAVSFDVDGAREVVISDQTGYLIPPKDVSALQTALIKLAQDKSLRDRMGANGRERFTDRFRHQTMTRRIREIYEEVLQG